MKVIDFIIDKLKILHSKFPTSNIRYEFRDSTKTHLIEITPLEFYNSESYMYYELEFEESFINEFPSEQIIFISDNSLNKITLSNFELFCEKKGGFRADFDVVNILSVFNELIEYNYLDSNNYALAA